MLEELSKKDSKWREIAMNICKCKDLADEITNLMYLRIYNYNVEPKKLTENYVGFVIYNLFRDHCKKPAHISIDKFYDIADETQVDTFSDEDLNILDKANKLAWWEKQLLTHSYDKSLRQIEKEFNISYQFVRRHNNKSKKFILGENYKKDGKRIA